MAHPEGPRPFDQDRPDRRGVVQPGEHSLVENQTVHFTDASEPTHAPDTTAARAKHSQGRLRRTFNRAFPAGSKRRTGIATAGVVGGTALGTVGGGAEWVGANIAEPVVDGTPDSTLAAEPFGVQGVSQGDAEHGVADNKAAHAAGEAAASAEAAPTPTDETAAPTTAETTPPVAEATTGGTPEASTEATAPETSAPTGGVGAEQEPDTGGIASSSSN